MPNTNINKVLGPLHISPVDLIPVVLVRRKRLRILRSGLHRTLEGIRVELGCLINLRARLSVNSPETKTKQKCIWEFPKIRDTLFWDPHNKDPTI